MSIVIISALALIFIGTGQVAAIAGCIWAWMQGLPVVTFLRSLILLLITVILWLIVPNPDTRKKGTLLGPIPPHI